VFWQAGDEAKFTRRPRAQKRSVLEGYIWDLKVVRHVKLDLNDS
jgi:hypothetical protein